MTELLVHASECIMTGTYNKCISGACVCWHYKITARHEMLTTTFCWLVLLLHQVNRSSSNFRNVKKYSLCVMWSGSLISCENVSIFCQHWHSCDCFLILVEPRLAYLNYDKFSTICWTALRKTTEKIFTVRPNCLIVMNSAVSFTSGRDPI